MSLIADQLLVVRGRRIVLDGVSLKAEAGSFLAIAGPNGAGKSTLLHTLGGSLVPTAGRVCLRDIDVHAAPPALLARHRSFLSQRPLSDPFFTAAETVRLGAEAAGQRDLKRAVARALEESGAAPLAHRRMGELSGGEAQRVQWARILAQIDGRPEGHCVLVDEPVTGMDLARQHELMERAAGLAARGACLVAVLHDLSLVLEYANQCILLANARIAAGGTPRQVLTPETIASVFGLRCGMSECGGRSLLWVERQVPANRRQPTPLVSDPLV